MLDQRQLNGMMLLFIGLGIVMALKTNRDFRLPVIKPANATALPAMVRPSPPPVRIPAEEVADSVLALDDEDGIDSEVTSEGAVIKLDETLLFQSGKADIQPHALPIMARIIALVREAPGNLRVEGHTDDEPIIHASAFRSNYELSVARAATVAAHLAETGGIDVERIAVVGYGALRPRLPNDSDAHRAKNRRVELVLQMNGASL